jgi:SAM-dependent methyltransferase
MSGGVREYGEIFRCPDCGGDLPDLPEMSSCAGCGRAFGRPDGPPDLMPGRAMHYDLTLPAGFTDPASIPGDAVYRYPERAGQPKSGVYHLDLAHLDVLRALPPGSLVIETGCGGGQMRALMHGMGHRYLGTDVSAERVHDWLREHGGADIMCDAHALPLRDGVADAVYAAAVWEHLAFPPLAAQEAARVLKPGGVMMGSASFLEPWHDESYCHMTPNGIYSTLVSAGLTPEHIWPERAWPGFTAILRMGNKATRLVAPLGRLMNMLYLAPKIAQFWLRRRRVPGLNDLYRVRGSVAGAIAWIARKPLAARERMTGDTTMEVVA